MPLIHCIITFCLAWLLGGYLSKYGKKWGLLSRPNPRRSETEGKPLIGGIAIYFSVSATALYFGFPQTKLLLLLSLPLLIVGIIDDRKELMAHHKLPIQTLVCSLWLTSYNSSEWLLVHLGVDPLLSFPLTLFWMVGIINAINIVDGIDGVAAGISFITLTLLAFFLHLPQPLFFAVVASACLGFLLRNWYPAKIYLGDAGSTLLGFWIAAGYSVLKLPATADIHILIPLLILAYPEFDTVFAICRRIKERRSPFTGDRRHIHHMLKDLGLTIRGAATTIIAITTILAFAAYSLGNEDDQFVRILAGHTIAASIGLFILVFQLHRKWNARTQEMGLYMMSLEHRKHPYSLVQTARSGIKIPVKAFFSHFHDPNLTRVQSFCSDFLETIAKARPKTSLLLQGDDLVILSEELIDDTAIENFKIQILECLSRNYIESWAADSIRPLSVQDIREYAPQISAKYPAIAKTIVS